MSSVNAEVLLLPLACLWVAAAEGVAMPAWVAALTAAVLGVLAFCRLVRGVRLGAPFFWLAGLSGWVAAGGLAQPVPWERAAYLFACSLAVLASALLSGSPRGRRWLGAAAVASGVLAAAWLVVERLALGGRPGGPTLNPNLAAGVAAFAFALLLAARRFPGRLLAAAVLLAGVLAAASRAASLAVLVAAGVVAGRIRRWRLPLLAAALLAAGGLAWRLATDRDPLRFERLRIWGTAIQVALAYAPWGTGPGGFSDTVLAFNFPREGEFARLARIPSLAENDWLHLAATLGLPGLVFALGLAASLLRRACRKGARELPPLAVLLVMGAFHTYLLWPVGAMLAPAAGRFAGKTRLRLSRPLALLWVWPWAVFLAVALAWPRGALGDRPQELEAAIGQALRETPSREVLAQALVHAEELVRIAPRASRSWELVGLVAYNLGSSTGDAALVRKAVEAFQSAQRRNPKGVWAPLGEATAWLALGESAPARAAAARAVQLEPNCVRCWLTLAQAQLFQGELAAAKRSFLRARAAYRQARAVAFVSGYERELAAWDRALGTRLAQALGVGP